MSKPSFLTGDTATIKINDTDLKEYGFICTKLNNSPPNIKQASESLMESDFNFNMASHYGSKSIIMTGTISGDTNSALQTNIESMFNLLKLNSDKDAKLELQNKTGYKYTIIYSSMSVEPIAKWFNGRKANCSISLTLEKPFREKTSTTTVKEDTNNGFALKKIENEGNFETPFNLKLTATGLSTTNLLGDVCSSTSGWTLYECTLAVDTTPKNVFYASAGLLATVTTPGTFPRANRNLLSLISTGKYYQVSVWSNRANFTPVIYHGSLIVDGHASTDDKMSRAYVNFDATPFVSAGGCGLQLNLKHGTGEIASISGVQLVEITADEYTADIDAVPYCGETSVNFFNDIDIKVIGKNLCPVGAKDMSVDNWKGTTSVYNNLNYDNEIMDTKTLLQKVTQALFSEPFFLKRNTEYTWSFKVKGSVPTDSSINYFGIVLLTERDAYLRNDSNLHKQDLINFNLNSRLDGDWHSVESTVTTPNENIPFYAIRLNNKNNSYMEIAEVMIEENSSKTDFEYYREQKLNFNNSVNYNGGYLQIDSEVNNAVDASSEDPVLSSMASITGKFPRLKQGTNYLVISDGRSDYKNEEYPSKVSSGRFNYELNYRERKI